MKAIGSIACCNPRTTADSKCTPGIRRDGHGDRRARAAAGWINGVVGVHPYQLAYADPRVADEVWAQDSTPGSPRPTRRRRRQPVDGGYIFNGRWQFSSGTDACDWIILGA